MLLMTDEAVLVQNNVHNSRVGLLCIGKQFASVFSAFKWPCLQWASWIMSKMLSMWLIMHPDFLCLRINLWDPSRDPFRAPLGARAYPWILSKYFVCVHPSVRASIRPPRYR
jgi:hypothetical protein